jgi:hypothetical protein
VLILAPALTDAEKIQTESPEDNLSHLLPRTAQVSESRLTDFKAGNEKIATALWATGACKAVGEDAAIRASSAATCPSIGATPFIFASNNC